MLSINTARYFARAITVICAVATIAVFSAVPAVSAQGIGASCDGVTRTLDITYSFAAKTGDLYTNVQDDSMAQLDVRDSANTNIAYINLRVNETYTIPASANGGTILASKLNTLAETARITCGEAAPTTTPTSAAQTSVTVQASVTQTAINTNIAGRFGSSGIAASSNGLTVSTRGLDTAIADLGEPEFNAWVGIEGRRFTGTTTGDSRNFSIGFDRLVSPNLVIGGYVSYNDQTATVGGASTTTKSPLFGAYAAHKLNNGLLLSGFVGYGRPDYTIGTTSFTATRKVAGLSMSGQFEAGNLRLTPLASLLSSSEDLPAADSFAADRLENTQASLTIRAEPLQRFASGILPYASLGAEYRRQGSNLGTYDIFTKQRIGLGFDWQLEAGNLRVDLDYGSINSTSNDIGLSFVYDFKF